MPLIWPSQRIAQAIGEGVIRVDRSPEADQVQPASLDLRLGAKAYRLPASFLPGPGRTVAERLAELSTHAVDLTAPTVPFWQAWWRRRLSGAKNVGVDRSRADRCLRARQLLGAADPTGRPP